MGSGEQGHIRVGARFGSRMVISGAKRGQIRRLGPGGSRRLMVGSDGMGWEQVSDWVASGWDQTSAGARLGVKKSWRGGTPMWDGIPDSGGIPESGGVPGWRWGTRQE